MRLSIVADDGKLVRLQSTGRIAQKDMPTDEDIFKTHLGEEAYGRKVLINMQDTEFLDSSGVAWLLRSHRAFEEAGGRLVLHTIPPVVLNVLKVLRMHTLLHVAESEQEALKKVG